MLVLTNLPLAHSTTETQSLIDSGCSATAFLDRGFAKPYSIELRPMPYPRKLLLADGRTSDTITKYAILPVQIGNHSECCLLYVTTLVPSTPIILGPPWLQKHNPSIDWTSMAVRMDSWYFLNRCCHGETKVQVVLPPSNPPAKSSLSRARSNDDRENDKDRSDFSDIRLL